MSVQASFCAFDTYGKHGLKLRECLEENPCAYLGMTVPDFPNFFFVFGPNTGEYLYLDPGKKN